MTPTFLLALAAAVAAFRSRRVPGLAPAARALCALLLLDVYHHACRPLLDARGAGRALSAVEVWALRLDAWILAGGWCAVVAWLLALPKIGDELDPPTKNMALGFRRHSIREEEARGKKGGSRLSRRGHSSFERMGPEKSCDMRLATMWTGRRLHGSRRRGCCHAHNKRPVWAPSQPRDHVCYPATWAVYGLFAVVVARIWPAIWAALLVAPRFAVGALAWWTSKKARIAQTASGPSPCSSLPLPWFAAPSRAFRRLTAGSSGYPQNDGRSLAPSLLIGQIIAACQVGAAAFLWSRWDDVRILSSACWVACAWVALCARP